MTEKCQRCGIHDVDMRHVTMECGYALEELNLPFSTSVWKSQAEIDRKVFQLSVCKNCRADWMQAIKTWFQADGKIDASAGTGVYVRHLGANMEQTKLQTQELLHKQMFDSVTNAGVTDYRLLGIKAQAKDMTVKECEKMLDAFCVLDKSYGDRDMFWVGYNT